VQKQKDEAEHTSSPPPLTCGKKPFGARRMKYLARHEERRPARPEADQYFQAFDVK
jgi:hypothetical protein